MAGKCWYESNRTSNYESDFFKKTVLTYVEIFDIMFSCTALIPWFHAMIETRNQQPIGTLS